MSNLEFTIQIWLFSHNLKTMLTTWLSFKIAQSYFAKEKEKEKKLTTYLYTLVCPVRTLTDTIAGQRLVDTL